MKPRVLDVELLESSVPAVLRDFGLRYASRAGVAVSRIWPPSLVVPWQDASSPRDSGIRTGCIWSISPTQV